MPVIKPIAGHTSVRSVSDYLQKDGRALAVDLYNLSWDEDRDAELDPDLKQDVDWAAEMDLTRIANGNNTPWRGKRARTYMHFIVSPDPKDKVTLPQLRELTRAWVRENWDDYECAAVFHDDNANEVMHAHVVVNNTNLATGNRFQNPDPRKMQASIQRLAEERGLSFFVDVSDEEKRRSAAKGGVAPKTRQAVYVRRAEREIAGKGGYSWVADIRNRVTIAKRAAETPGEYLQILGLMGVDVSEASRKGGRSDWLYSMAETPSKRIRGENLGLAYGRKAVEGALKGNAAIDPDQIAAIAAKAVEVKDYAQLESMATALELCSRYGIRCMADFGSRIAAMGRRRGDERAAQRRGDSQGAEVAARSGQGKAPNRHGPVRPTKTARRRLRARRRAGGSPAADPAGAAAKRQEQESEMILEMTYSDGHHECFDSNSLTGGAVFGRANILTEFDVVWEEGEGGQHLVVYEHHMEESAPSDDEASANADRIRGPRLKLIDSSEVPSIESVSLDGRLLTWSQGGCLVDAAKFELACMKWYSGPMGAGANAKAVALFRYLERARPELASDEAEICPLFGYPVAAFREAEDEEMAQAGGADCGEGGFDEVD